MVWFIKFHFLLPNIYFRFSGFQARSLFTFATVRIGVYTALKCGTEPIRYVTFLFRDWRGAASSVTEIAPKSSLLCVNRRPTRYDFRAGAKALR